MFPYKTILSKFKQIVVPSEKMPFWRLSSSADQNQSVAEFYSQIDPLSITWNWKETWWPPKSDILPIVRFESGRFS